MTTHLQGIGEMIAKPAEEFKIGEDMMWNYGYLERVINIIKITEKTIVFGILYAGKHYKRRLNKNRLVVIG